MAPLLHRQPFRSLYVIFLFSRILVKVPLWILISLPRSRRPCRSWSIGKCVRVHLLRAMMNLPMESGLLMARRDLSVEVPDSQLKDAKFVWVHGVDEGSVQGEIREYAQRTGVKPARIPGYWQFKAGAATPEIQRAGAGEKVLYHLHGGGMTHGSAHPADMTALIPRGLLQHSTALARTFAVDYRLSASPPRPAANPFPAGLLDCIAGYQYLVGLGFRPEDIILAGDSAGGNLALALLRYLTLNTVPGLAPPGQLLLLSPWTDPASSRTAPTSSFTANAASDIFPVGPLNKGSFGSYGATSYLGPLPRDELKTNKFMAPGSPHLADTAGMFAGFPRTYISAGQAERILDDATVIADRLKADNPAPGWVTLDVAADAVHDFIIFPWAEPERSETLVRISKWLDKA